MLFILVYQVTIQPTFNHVVEGSIPSRLTILTS